VTGEIPGSAGAAYREMRFDNLSDNVSFMTIEQEQIAEKVIQLHKDNNGIYDWKDFVDVFSTTHNDRLVIARALRDKDIIGDHTTGTRLKEPGWAFKGFESERQTDLLDKKRQERKDKSDELDLQMKEWQVRTKKLPYILSALALVGTIISISIAFKALNKKQDQQDLQPMKEKIQVLQDRVKMLDSLRQADTLLKKRT